MTGVSILVRLGISRGWHVRLLTRGKFYAATLLHCMFVYLHLRYQLRRGYMWITNYYIACLNHRYLIHVFYMRFPSFRQTGRVLTKQKSITWRPMYKARRRYREKPSNFYRLPGYNVFQTPRPTFPVGRTLPTGLVGESITDEAFFLYSYAMGSGAARKFKHYTQFSKRYKFHQQHVGISAAYFKVRFAAARRAFGCGRLSSTLTTPVVAMLPSLRRNGTPYGLGEFYRQPNGPKTTVVKTRRQKSIAEQAVDQARIVELRREELAAQGKVLFTGMAPSVRKQKVNKKDKGKKAAKKGAKGSKASQEAASAVEYKVDKASAFEEIPVNRVYDASSIAIFDPAYREAWAHSSRLVQVLFNRMALAGNTSVEDTATHAGSEGTFVTNPTKRFVFKRLRTLRSAVASAGGSKETNLTKSTDKRRSSKMRPSRRLFN